MCIYYSFLRAVTTSLHEFNTPQSEVPCKLPNSNFFERSGTDRPSKSPQRLCSCSSFLRNHMMYHWNLFKLLFGTEYFTKWPPQILSISFYCVRSFLVFLSTFRKDTFDHSCSQFTRLLESSSRLTSERWPKPPGNMNVTLSPQLVFWVPSNSNRLLKSEAIFEKGRCNQRQFSYLRPKNFDPLFQA
jgi:hypothetical protein